MHPLVIIPARGGSKGIPHKNIKVLGGKPLIYYTLDVARGYTSDANICVSTDDADIARVVSEYGLTVPFMRPEYLSTDDAGMNDVLLHSLEYYEKIGEVIDVVILLQATSPFRTLQDVKNAVDLYDDSVDMVTSVCRAQCNPYYDGYEENSDGLLTVCKGDGRISRRQDAPSVWQQNGAIYVINPYSLKTIGLSGMSKIRKYEMDEIRSIDIDTIFDWKIAELLLQEGIS